MTHAVAEYAARSPEAIKATPIAVVLEVPDEDDLLEWADRLGSWAAPSQRIPHVCDTVDCDDPHLFHEPDLGDAGEHTALAVVSDGRTFSTLPLAGGCR